MRANVEAVVEAGRVAAEGARTIGQDVVAKQRDSFEQAADAIRSLAEALVRAFASVGWRWGSSFGDYQHFSPTGR